jgi:hypothetical protein
MRHLRVTLFAVSLVLIVSTPAWPAGTVTVTSASCGSLGDTDSERCYTVTWVSTSGGAVSANTAALSAISRGYLISVEITPGVSGDQPADLYDMTLVNPRGVDLLSGVGANLSNVTSTMYQFNPPLFYSALETFDLVVANAGDSNSGTIRIVVATRR